MFLFAEWDCPRSAVTLKRASARSFGGRMTKFQNREELCAEIMAPEQLAENRVYHRIQLRCSLLDMAVDLVLFALLAFFFGKPLTEYLAGFAIVGDSWVRQFTALMVCVSLIHVSVSLPFSFFSGWVVEQRFGLSNLTAFHWLRRWLLQMALVLPLNFCLMLGLFWIIRVTGPWWWAVASGVFFFFSIVLGTLFPVVVLPLFYRVERLEDPALMASFQKLAGAASLKLSGIYRLDLSIETSKANAMIAGFGRTRRVLLGDTLLKNFQKDEIAAVFAHELGHHVCRHMLKGMLGMLLASFGIYWLADLGLRFWFGGSLTAELNYAELPVWSILFFMFAISIIMAVLEPFQNAVSRRHERQADAHALTLCGPDALRRAFVKLAIQNKADPFPSAWEVFWLHSHPAIGERIMALGVPDSGKCSGPECRQKMLGIGVTRSLCQKSKLRSGTGLRPRTCLFSRTELRPGQGGGFGRKRKLRSNLAASSRTGSRFGMRGASCSGVRTVSGTAFRAGQRQRKRMCFGTGLRQKMELRSAMTLAGRCRSLKRRKH